MEKVTMHNWKELKVGDMIHYKKGNTAFGKVMVITKIEKVPGSEKYGVWHTNLKSCESTLVINADGLNMVDVHKLDKTNKDDLKIIAMHIADSL